MSSPYMVFGIKVLKMDLGIFRKTLLSPPNLTHWEIVVQCALLLSLSFPTPKCS